MLVTTLYDPMRSPVCIQVASLCMHTPLSFGREFQAPMDV